MKDRLSHLLPAEEQNKNGTANIHALDWGKKSTAFHCFPEV